MKNSGNVFKKDKGNSLAYCQICFKSLRCKASLTNSALQRHFEHSGSTQSTILIMFFEPMPTAS